MTATATPTLDECRDELKELGERRSDLKTALDGIDAEIARAIVRARSARMMMDEIAHEVGVSRKTLYSCVDRHGGTTGARGRIPSR